MNILAIETSTQACSACLKMGEEVVCETELAPQKHANILLEQIDRLFKKTKLSPNTLDALAFGEGPGAFTGIRIAAGVIQGLAYGWQKPVVAVSSLEVMAYWAMDKTGQRESVACLDARMKELYVQRCYYQNGRFLSDPPALMNAVAFERWIEGQTAALGVGDIADEFPEVSERFSHWESAYPQAEGVASLASQRLDDAHSVLHTLPQPVYLRNNVAEKPKAAKNL